MPHPIYDKVADAVNARAGYPTPKCPELIDILEFLFTQEEAELAVKMPFEPVSVEALAQNTGEDPERVQKLLESMANKALVFTQKTDDGITYVLVPLLPGTFEVQFMRGVKDESTIQLAHLFQKYFDATAPADGKPRSSYTKVPFARVITVEEEIPAGIEIHIYDKVSEYIDKSDLISIGTCYCRFFAELMGDPCDRPKENCFSFDEQARFMIERGFNKQVTKEEAKRVMAEAEKAGLVHCSSNTSDVIQFMCNCCSCHCGIMKSIKMSDSPNAAASSSFILSVDEEACVGCGECIDRCQVDALTMTDDVVSMNIERCIGCGLCVSACTSGALKMVAREEAPVPPLNQQELGMAMLTSVQEQNQ